jgi:3-polyprenyl-4-hydroxybenzoate decarboxylase
VVIVPNLSDNLLDPASEPPGMAHKMIIDATTPIPPDRRGHYGQELDQPHGADTWLERVRDLIAKRTS